MPLVDEDDLYYAVVDPEHAEPRTCGRCKTLLLRMPFVARLVYYEADIDGVSVVHTRTACEQRRALAGRVG